jgi:hypothetical protein
VYRTSEESYVLTCDHLEHGGIITRILEGSNEARHE